MFTIRLGIPEMKVLWANLVDKSGYNELGKDEEKLYKKWGKAMALLAGDPRHPGLKSREIEALSRRYGMKVWQSYLENSTSGAGRLFWVCGPQQGEIMVIGLEPHPEDKKSAGYAKVTLSSMGKEDE